MVNSENFGVFEDESEDPGAGNGEPALQDWKILAIGLHVIGGLAVASFASGGLQAELVGRAFGVGIGLAFWFYVATWVYRKGNLGLGLIPGQAYKAIVLLAAVISSPATVAGPSTGFGVFILLYGLLSTIAILTTVGFRGIQSVRDGADVE